jgi:peptidoglycan/LPS O-acetylase OafA/YrhL
MLLFANFAIVFNSGGYFSPNAAQNPLLNTWSLSVEEQFYLVFPIVLLVAWWLGSKLKRPIFIPVVIVALGAAISFGLAVLAASGWSPKAGAALISFYSPVTRVWEFAAGALLLLLTRKLSRSTPTRSVVLAILGLALMLISVFTISEGTPFPGAWTLLPVGATVLLLLAGETGSNFVSRALATRPMAYVGDRSYSLYLWHWPFIVFAMILWPGNELVVLVAVLLSIPVALASFRWVEQPLRLRREIRGWKFMGLIALVMVPPIALSQMLGFGARNDWGNSNITSARAAVNSAGEHLRGECVDDASIGGNNEFNAGACTLNPDATGTPIFLVGDSNSVIYSEALLDIAEEQGRPLVMHASALCPFIDVIRTSEHGEDADRACRDYYEQTMNDLTSAGAGTVVIGESSGYWYEENLDIVESSVSSDPGDSDRSSLLRSGLTSTVNTLENAGLQVILVTPNYQFRNSVSLELCNTLGLIRGTCPGSVTEASALQGQMLAKADVTDVAQTLAVPLIDVSELQCPRGVCGPMSNGMPVYLDASHLSPSLLALSAPQFAEAFKQSK